MASLNVVHVETAKEALKSLSDCSIAVLVIYTVLLALRLVSRSIVKKIEIGYDDILIALAYLANVGTCAVALGKLPYRRTSA